MSNRSRDLIATNEHTAMLLVRGIRSLHDNRADQKDAAAKLAATLRCMAKARNEEAIDESGSSKLALQEHEELLDIATILGGWF